MTKELGALTPGGRFVNRAAADDNLDDPRDDLIARVTRSAA
jgi:hypothetical protein